MMFVLETMLLLVVHLGCLVLSLLAVFKQDGWICLSSEGGIIMVEFSIFGSDLLEDAEVHL
jgi:hypothetical protein